MRRADALALAALIVAGLLAGLLLGAFLRAGVEVAVEAPVARASGIISLVVHRATGEVERRVLPFHSFTENGVKLLAGILYPSSPYKETMVGTGGSSGTRLLIYDGSNTLSTPNYDVTGQAWWIVFGNGTSPQYSFTKYSLDSEVARAVISEPSLTYNATHLLVSFSASFTPDFSVNITEAGLLLKVSSAGDYLIAYDVIPGGVYLNANDTLTITYTFAFQSDQIFVENWGQVLWIVFQPYAKKSTTVTTTNGGTATVGTYYANSEYACKYAAFAIGSGTTRAWIVFGNGTSPSFSRTAYAVASEVARVAPSTVSIAPDGSHISVSATYSAASAVNITEVALYMLLEQYDSTDDNYAEVMVFYYVFPNPVELSPGQSLTVTFKILLP